jgi:hypothetical protein
MLIYLVQPGAVDVATVVVDVMVDEGGPAMPAMWPEAVGVAAVLNTAVGEGGSGMPVAVYPGPVNVGTVVVDTMVDGDGSGMSAAQLVSSRPNTASRAVRCLVFIFYLWRKSAAIQ